MNDQETVERLRAGLDDLTASISAEPPPLDPATDPSPSGTEPRPRPWRSIVSVAAGLLVVAATVGVWSSRQGRDLTGTGASGTAPAPSSPAPPVGSQPAPDVGTQPFDGLDIDLDFPTVEVPSGGELTSRMRVANNSGRTVVDPSCLIGSARYALVPVDEPDPDLWLRPVVDCGGPYPMPDGYEDSHDGPAFPATDRFGEPLVPGRYLAVVAIDGRTEPLRYPVTVTPPLDSIAPLPPRTTTEPTDRGALTAMFDDALGRWEESALPGYHMWVEGSIDGTPVSAEVLVDDGTVERLDGSDRDEALTVDELFRLIRRAIPTRATVDADYDDTWGYPSQLVITGDDRDVDLTVTQFEPFERPSGCASPPGSPSDLSSEPAAWLLYNEFLRWTDADGCPVRVDVIAHYRGPEHCDWQAMEFVTVGIPPGTPFRDDVASSTYVWDPDDVLGDFDDVNRARTIDVTELPATAADTGFRQNRSELWFDSADPDVAYRVTGANADVLVRDAPRRILCA